MKLKLDHSSPVPLYHQITEAIRYRIATGEIAPGAALPPLREAARLWGAHLHTVRRAYAELARRGVVVTRIARGTVVQPTAARSHADRAAASRLDTFLERVLREARVGHGLGAGELAGLLEARRAAESPERKASVYVAECSETQSADLAQQLMARWRVAAVPWSLDHPPPPAGVPIIATFFHFNEVRSRWSDRLGEVRFMAIRPDPALGERLRRSTNPGARATVTLCEREPEMLHNILADLQRLLPGREFRIEPKIVRTPDRWLAQRRSRHPVLFSPRVWGELSAKTRRDPRAHEASFVFDRSELDAIGPVLGWSPR